MNPRSEFTRLRQYIELAKCSGRDAAEAKLEAFFILYTLHRQDVIWRDTYSSWRALLAGEGVACAAWERFKLGFEAIRKDEDRARVLGLTVLRRISLEPQARRALLVRRLETQPVREALASVKPKLRVRPEATAHTRTELAEYIHRLRAACVKAGVKLPKTPW